MLVFTFAVCAHQADGKSDLLLLEEGETRAYKIYHQPNWATDLSCNDATGTVQLYSAKELPSLTGPINIISLTYPAVVQHGGAYYYYAFFLNKGSSVESQLNFALPVDFLLIEGDRMFQNWEATGARSYASVVVLGQSAWNYSYVSTVSQNVYWAVENHQSADVSGTFGFDVTFKTYNIAGLPLICSGSCTPLPDPADASFQYVIAVPPMTPYAGSDMYPYTIGLVVKSVLGAGPMMGIMIAVIVALCLLLWLCTYTRRPSEHIASAATTTATAPSPDHHVEKQQPLQYQQEQRQQEQQQPNRQASPPPPPYTESDAFK